MQQSFEDEQWREEVMYLCRAFGAWYVAYQAFDHFICSSTISNEQMKSAKLVIDADWAINQLGPPVKYAQLHQKMQYIFQRARASVETTRLDFLPSDILEDLQIVGVAIRQQLELLGINSDVYN